VAAAAGEGRRRHPLLPSDPADPARAEARLAGLAGSGLGVAAVQGRRVVGFLLPVACELWGGPGAYVPEWGQAGAPEMVAPLYAAASALWMAAGRTIHGVTLWSHQPAAETAWHDLGFGRVVVDALRGLESLPRRARGVTVRFATPRDAFTLAAWERALWEHLAAAPVSRVFPAPGGKAEAAARLADPAQPVWLAEVAGRPAGFISLQPADEVPAALRCPELVRCDGAFVVPERRGRGVAATLLGEALRWAAGAGFNGCTLDFESANVPAARFWPAAGFSPVLHSVGRHTA
jgi:GNAT superfamily N-acetyltransferase